MTDNRHVSATRKTLLVAAAVTVAAAVAHDGRCARCIAPATTARSSRLARCEQASASRGVLLTCKPSIRVPCGEDQQVRVPDVPTHGGSPLVSHVKLFLVIPIGSTFHPMKDPRKTHGGFSIPFSLSILGSLSRFKIADDSHDSHDLRRFKITDDSRDKRIFKLPLFRSLNA
ncbi:hypothetical protein ALC56_01246 [Trachymyrmex septentrionalis]|uniref:Uncharacterized protein n=1 Tax=Trachymyrmex septentrionalis TaxID=34720 RepID=A0A195FUF9_9HYME|nr:hypothetical protein ALC56_01246 [Trachymyrmex septentrionalis]